MKLLRQLAGLLAWSGLVASQVHVVPEDLKIQTVWENVWGVVQIVFLPDDKVLLTHKTGELHVYPNINAKSTDFTTIYDINEQVYSWWDHGMLSAALHPDFPEQPYLYVVYSAEYPGKPWNDQCVPDPKKEKMTNPPDTRPYCKSMAKLVRLKVDPEFTKAELDQELIEDWCTSTYTHHIGTIQFLQDGSMFYGAGDGSHFQGIDTGAPQDECTDPKGPIDQGIFTVLKDNYVRGKFFVINKDAIIAPKKLDKKTDMKEVARGVRNPFRSCIDPKSGDIYFGDVGSAVWEEINHIPNPLTATKNPHFGWPCIEGEAAASEIYQNWLRDHALLGNCAPIYKGNFNKPVFQYRFGAVDPDFPDICADADASVSGIQFYTGDKLPENYQTKLFFVDYSKKCAFYFNYGDDGLPDFSHAHAIVYSEKGLTAGGLTDIKTGPDGYLYMTDYSGGMVYRVLAADDDSLDAIIAANGGGGSSKDDIDVWVSTTPGPYEWVYGDEIKFVFQPGMDVEVDPASIKYRVTNLHCVLNTCTLQQDCHVHEVSLPENSRSGLKGSFHPSPHPMESFIRITASFVANDQAYSKDFYTHAKTYNYKIDSEPMGFPVIFEETVCPGTPCIVSMMAKINTGFFVQQIQSKGDKVYQFKEWQSTDLTTLKTRSVKGVGYEQLAVADEHLVAMYEAVPVTVEKAMAPPTGVTATGDHQRVLVAWTAAAEGGPDFIIINIKPTGKNGEAKTATQSARRESTVVDLPPGANKYTVTTAFYDSKTKKKGLASNPVAFESLAKAPANSPIPCVYNQYAEKFKTKTVGKDTFGLALVGTTPNAVYKGMNFKVTIDVMAPKPMDLQLNLLEKGTFDWAGGKNIKITEKNRGIQSISFKVDKDVADGEYYIDALLVPPGKDYKAKVVEVVSEGIKGIQR